MRMHNLAWIRSKIENLEEQKFVNVELCYKMNNSSDFGLFEQKISKILESVIS